MKVTKAVHIGVVASLLLALGQAPFRHTHESDPHHGHATGLAHSHLKIVVPSGTAWEAPDSDSDARMLDWLAGDGKAPVKLKAELPESVLPPMPVAAFSQTRTASPRSHDPPWQRSLHPRAPPA